MPLVSLFYGEKIHRWSCSSFKNLGLNSFIINEAVMFFEIRAEYLRGKTINNNCWYLSSNFERCAHNDRPPSLYLCRIPIIKDDLNKLLSYSKTFNKGNQIKIILVNIGWISIWIKLKTSHERNYVLIRK